MYDEIYKKIYNIKKYFKPEIIENLYKDFIEFFDIPISFNKNSKEIVRIIYEKQKIEKSYELKLYYLLNFIIDKFSYTDEYYNVSFLDIIDSGFNKFKCGFTGTPNENFLIMDEKGIDKTINYKIEEKDGKKILLKVNYDNTKTEVPVIDEKSLDSNCEKSNKLTCNYNEEGLICSNIVDTDKYNYQFNQINKDKFNKINVYCAILM